METCGAGHRRRQCERPGRRGDDPPPWEGGAGVGVDGTRRRADVTGAEGKSVGATVTPPRPPPSADQIVAETQRRKAKETGRQTSAPPPGKPFGHKLSAG